MNTTKKHLKFSGNLAYILGAAFVIAAVFLTLLPPQPVLAGTISNGNPGAISNGNSGAIWTTSSTCGDTTQDANSFSIGEDVYINGDGFDPDTTYSWEISGKPGGASGDPNIAVASGNITTDASGVFCFAAYTVAGDDWGEYSVKVGNKGDNYRVGGAAAILGCTDPNALNYNQEATQDNGTCQYRQVDVCPNIEGNQATLPDGFGVDGNGECVPFITLSLSAFCSDVPAATNGWTGSNPNAFAVDAEWRINGSLLAGLLNIPANSSVNFTTPVSEGSIAEIYYGGVFQDDASAAQECVRPDDPGTPENPGTTEKPGTLETTQVQALIPSGGGTAVLIPVTGVDNNLSGTATVGSFSLGLGFFGLGTVLHGIARRRVH